MGSCTYNTELFPPMKQLVSDRKQDDEESQDRCFRFLYLGVAGEPERASKQFALKSCASRGPVIEAKVQRKRISTSALNWV